MIANRQAMTAFRKGETFDQAEIRAIVDRRGGLIADMTVLHARVHDQMKEMLTPEQLERFERRYEATMAANATIRAELTRVDSPELNSRTRSRCFGPGKTKVLCRPAVH